MAGVGIMEWADKQADCVRDALRRHATGTAFKLDDSHKSEVSIRVRHLGGFPSDQALEYLPLTAGHLKTTMSNDPLIMMYGLSQNHRQTGAGRATCSRSKES